MERNLIPTQNPLNLLSGNSMKKGYLRYIFHSLKDDITRLIAIMLITALGAGVLIGLYQSADDVKASIEQTYQKGNMYDLDVKSNIGFYLDGFEDGLTDYITSSLDEYSSEEYSFIYASEIDMNIKIEGTTYYSKVIASDLSINSPIVQEGRMPEKQGEILALTDNPTLTQTKIGDIVTIDNTDFTVVGLAISPQYIYKVAPTANQASKVLTQVFFLDSSLYDSDELPASLATVTDIYFDFYALDEISIFQSDYSEIISPYQEAVEEIFTSQTFIDSNIKGLLIKQGLPEILITQETIDLVKEQMSPTSYTLTRDQDRYEVMFRMDVNKLTTIANIFPAFFFIVAMLVTLASISRIITKDRIRIGTLKSLGFTNAQISFKYYLYAILACLIGGVGGVFIGVFLIPYVSVITYGSLYVVPSVIFQFTWWLNIVIPIAILACSLIVIFIVFLKYYKLNAAELIHDVSPKPGKKIVLEKIPFFWKRISFKYKSMFRNIFRYKKNLISMIVGVGGCTALLLTGFGLKDSISVLSEKQYTSILKYNFLIETEDPNFFLEDTSSEAVLRMKEKDAIYYSSSVSLNLDPTYTIEFYSGDDFTSYVNFNDASNGQAIEFNDDSVIISRQLSENFDIDKGDVIEVNVDSYPLKLNVTGVMENYVSNYIFAGKNSINKYNEEHPDDINPTNFDISKYNAVICNVNLDGIDSDSYIDELLSIVNVTNVSYTARSLDTYSAMMESLNAIVIILVFISGGLAVIVIYNLVDININERVKEISTLRVIGYQKNEVIMYVFREIILMSIIGMLVGLAAGVLLHMYAMSELASPGIIFGKNIYGLSYLYTILLTVGFAIIATFAQAFKIVKINMVESLKAVE